MADYLISDETLINLGNAVRTLSGSNETITPNKMISTVNEAKSAMDALNEHKADKNNPHGITAESIGAVSLNDITILQNEINNLKANLSPSCKSGSLTFSGRHNGSTISTPSGTTIKYIVLKLNSVGWYDDRNPGSVNLGYLYEIKKDASYSGNFQIYSDGSYTVTAMEMSLSGNSFSYDYIQLKKTGLTTYYTGQINYEIYYV